MATIITRAGKGSPLTNNEVDSNFINLNTDKLETSTVGVSVQPFDATLLNAATIGVTVQGYDADTAKTDVAQTFTARQRTNETTDNDGSFDLDVANDFVCTPSGPFTLTFTNIPTTPAVQKGTILLINSGAHAVSAAATTKVGSATLAIISAAGTYTLGYRTSNGNVYVTASGAQS